MAGSTFNPIGLIFMKGDHLIIRGHEFGWGTRTYVMGIINITPDSFSGDGLLAAGSGKNQGWRMNNGSRRPSSRAVVS